MFGAWLCAEASLAIIVWRAITLLLWLTLTLFVFAFIFLILVLNPVIVVRMGN